MDIFLYPLRSPLSVLSHLAAAVAVAAALHGAVHAGEASEAEATALDAAALTWGCHGVGG